MISLTTADNALKNVYLDVINNQLNNELDPFYSKIEKTSNDIAGNTIKKMVTLGINGGIGAGAEDGSLPTARENNYVQLNATLKNLYGRLEITDKAVRVSQNDSGAFLNLLNAEMDNLIESSKFNLRHMLYGDGSGYVGDVIGCTRGSVVYQVNEARPFVVGMRLNGYIDMELQSNLTDVEVVDVDYTNNTITLQTSAAATADFDEDTTMEFMMSNNTNPITGLGSIMSEAGSIYGLSKAQNAFIRPTMEQYLVNDFDYIKALQCADNIKINFGGNTDLIVTGYGWRRNFQTLLKNNAINCDILSLEGGCKAISLNGIPVYATRFMSDMVAYFIDSSVFTMHQLCDWQWLSNDKGQVLHQKEGYAAHCATLVKYCELICSRACYNTAVYLI